MKTIIKTALLSVTALTIALCATDKGECPNGVPHWEHVAWVSSFCSPQ